MIRQSVFGMQQTNPEIRKEKKNYASSKKLLTSIKEKGPLGKKSPFTRKEKGGSVRIRSVAGRLGLGYIAASAERGQLS